MTYPETSERDAVVLDMPSTVYNTLNAISYETNEGDAMARLLLSYVGGGNTSIPYEVLLLKESISDIDIAWEKMYKEMKNCIANIDRGYIGVFDSLRAGNFSIIGDRILISL